MPYFLHPDEEPKVVSATRLVEQLTLDPAYFKHPALLLYSTAAAGEIAAQLSGQPPTPVTRLLAGRRAVGLFGALTVLATWALGRETGRLLLQRGVELPGGAELCGLLAAAALAVAPLHVATSHYLKEDVPLTLWTTLALLAALRLAAGRAEGRPVQVAIACGLAVSTKYVGVLTLLLVPAADWLRSADGAGWRPRLARALRRGAVAALAAAAIFLLLNPWFLADRQRLGQELRFEASHGLVEGHRAVRSGPWRTWWSFHLRRSLLPGATAPLLIAGLAGLVLLTRRRGGPARLLPIAALGWYLAHEASPLKPPPFPDRYMVPLLPLIAVGAATAIQRLAGIPRRPGRPVRPLILTAATMLLLAAPALRSLELVAAMSSDTRLAARAWILGHLLPGS
ncbi:MAG TPA: phospholipid carrier-dependent glycosyltransferase, partial [Thermoanaerobaculia bacterium]|nr:phospholipid carrier-dependent glycosyltransferase [Thermoanaerobaculia bacterium]